MLTRLQKGDRVITPRDEVGYVLSVTDAGYVHGEYEGALSPTDKFFTLSERLLVLWKQRNPRPAPYRAPLVATMAGARR